MNVFVLHDTPDPTAIRRWSLSAGFVAAVHATLILAVMFWYTGQDAPGTASQPVMIDLESTPPTTEAKKPDVAPGPEMQEAPPPPPEPEKKTATEDNISPTPLQSNPVIVAPPERKEKPKPVEKPRPVVDKPPRESVPAPRTAATPQAAQAARASYNGMLSAHLQRYKQYPSGAKAAGQQGVAMLSFTVSRSGQVLNSRLAGSSGSPALDAETMSMIRRAQPLPSFLPDMPQSSLSFTVPIRFLLR